jgi:hypothetical protein
MHRRQLFLSLLSRLAADLVHIALANANKHGLAAADKANVRLTMMRCGCLRPVEAVAAAKYRTRTVH